MDPGFDASDAATAEVSRQLALAEHLPKVKQLKADYEAKLESVSSQLSHLVQSQVEEVKQGRLLFDASERSVFVLRKKLENLHRATKEKGGWAEEYNLLKSVSDAEKNMGIVASYLRKVLEIPREVEELEELLSELGPFNPALDQLPPLNGDDLLWRCHTKAMLVDELCHSLSRRNGKQGREQAGRGSSILQSTIVPAKKVVEREEEYLFNVLRNSITLCTSHPSLVVAAVAIVEEEEDKDVLRENNDENPDPKQYRSKLISTIEESVISRFREVYNPVDGLSQDVGMVLEGFDALLDHLTTVTDDLMICFPPHYRSLLKMSELFHTQFSMSVRALASDAKELTPADILDIVLWINSYSMSLQRLGLEEGDPPLSDALPDLIEAYTETSKGLMRTWATNILNVDEKASVEQADDGTVITLAPIDLFKMVTQQIDLVKDVDNGKFLWNIVRESVEIIMVYIRDLKKRLKERWSEYSWDYLAAMVNNNIKSLELLEEFAEHCVESLSDMYAEGVPTDKAMDGFRDLVKLSVKSLARVVMKDLEGLSSQIFGPEWLEGTTTDNIIETFRDYFNDFADVFTDYGNRLVTTECMEQLLKMYIDAVDVYGKKEKLGEEDMDFLNMLEVDNDKLTEFFGGYMRDGILKKNMGVIEAMREIISGTSEDSIVASYAVLLATHSDAPLSFVKSSLRCNPHFSKKDTSAAIDQCKTVILSRRNRKPGLFAKFGMIDEVNPAEVKPDKDEEEGEGEDGEKKPEKEKSKWSKLKKHIGLHRGDSALKEKVKEKKGKEKEKEKERDRKSMDEPSDATAPSRTGSAASNPPPSTVREMTAEDFFS
uniref:Exocyst complex component Sec6 n=1 Tax=Palpitomonas bilix TaxID=652834 RepID=A0A7S3D9P0_9EUKA|mmetsp:Transcript_26159/g.66468  ORF Transcript_26159/g.66468 Transcript_26159/m.66468 type:complete len:830 (+) Transcript_26159:220-2709(+)